MKLTTYLTYGGNCAEALRFYEKHLDGRIVMMETYDQMPEPKQIPPSLGKNVLHARIQIGDVTIMASDSPPDRHEPMRSVFLCLNVDSNSEAERLYALLADGGKIMMAMEETFYAHRFAMLGDKFGTLWMIIHERPMPAAA